MFSLDVPSPTEFAKALANAAGRSHMLDDAETREILGRAVAMEAQRLSEAEATASSAELSDAAERGRKAAVEQSPTLGSLRSSLSTRASFASEKGGKLRFQRELDGEISEAAHETLVEEIDARLGIVGRISSFGRSVTWSPAAPSDEERNVVVKVTPNEGRTRIYVEERVELAGFGKSAPFVGAFLGMAAGLFVGAALRASFWSMGLLALGLAGAGAFLAAKAAMRSICNRRRPELEQLANRLTEIAALSKWDSDTPL